MKNPGKNVCLSGSVCGEPDCTNCKMNRAQKETYIMLLSEVDNLEVADCGEDDPGVFVFEGWRVDGPTVGYIEKNGKVTWIC